MATTTRTQTVTITPDTDPAAVIGRRCTFRRGSSSGGTVPIAGVWTQLIHMSFEGYPGQKGMGGSFNSEGEEGRTALWIPYGTALTF